MNDSLTPAERQAIIERVLDLYQWRWLEQIARQAKSEVEAVSALRRYGGNGGEYHPDGFKIEYRHERIEVRMPDGREGVISWLEVVRAARAESQQLCLF